MTYPPAPWTLKGYAFLTLQLVDVEKVRPFIPKELEIISLWPGKTLGGVYVSSYGLGSVMEYNELIVTNAIVSFSDQWGAWISHMYVDNRNSLAGGREIWGLPKEMADFHWEDGNKSSVTVTQGNRQLCSLNYNQPSWAWPMSLSGQALSALGTNFIWFKSEFFGRVGLISSQLEIPSGSPFVSFDFGQPWLTVYCEDMNLVVSNPEVLGDRTLEYSY